jgi:hypothetical protein
MRLLVSVSDIDEARAALEGGADVIDAKDPAAGALGAVSVGTLRGIHAAIGGRAPVSAALGDAADERDVETAVEAFASTGVTFVKLGVGTIADASRVTALLAAAVRGARTAGPGRCGVVAVAYADAGRAAGLGPAALARLAADAGASGILVDTQDKRGPGLTGLVTKAALTTLVRGAHDAGLLVALAGRLAADDLPHVREAGADIAGVRGAACEGGRTGRVSAALVRALRTRCTSMPVGSGVSRTVLRP